MPSLQRSLNILFLVSEDCPPKLGCYGDPLARTPHVDRLAAEGVRFSNAYCAAPVCAPSRFGLISGMYPQTCGPAHHMEARAHFPAQLATYPQLLRQVGYYCSNNAKTHYNCDIVAAEIWDDSSRTAHWRGRAEGQPFIAVFNLDVTHESAVFDRAGFVVDPAEVTVPGYLPDTEEIRADFAHYYRAVQEMDVRLGELVAELAQDGLLEQTAIVYSSDHGGVGPRSKRFCYDEGLHVPLVIRLPRAWSGRLGAPGAVVDTAVCTVDLPATFLELAGVTAPAVMQSRSLLGRAPGPSFAVGARNRMDERYDMIRTVRDDRYRYIRNYSPHRPWGQHQAYAWLARGYQSWEQRHLDGTLSASQELFWRHKPATELYDTLADPDEITNLSGREGHAHIEQVLHQALATHMIAVNDNGFLPEGSPAEGYQPSREPGAYDLRAVMELADQAIMRDPGRAAMFAARLTDPDPTLRYWAAQALLMLGKVDAACLGALARASRRDDPAVAVAAAEALARNGQREAVQILADYAAPGQPFPVRLAALNALTYIPRRMALLAREVVAASADDPQEYIRGSGRYLDLVLAGQYRPSSRVFLAERVDFSRSVT